MKKVESIKPTGVLADMIEDFKKDLLLKDLAARLYGVKCNVNGKVRTLTDIGKYGCRFDGNDAFYGWDSEDIKPFLRPMSDMTETEKVEYESYQDDCFDINGNPCHAETDDSIDFLNGHYFDYRGLLSLGLALEAPKGMYNFEEEED